MDDISKMHIRDLSTSMGWKVLRDHMDDIIKSNSNKLLIVEATDAAKVREYQMTIKVLNSIKYFVDKKDN